MREEKQKRSLELWADKSDLTLEIKKGLENYGYEVNHILSASEEPIIRTQKDNMVIGYFNIKKEYNLN